MNARQDHELREAIRRLSEAARLVVGREAAAGVDATKRPCCAAINIMKARGWPPERALIMCKRVCGAEMDPTNLFADGENRSALLMEKVVHWLIECYFGE